MKKIALGFLSVLMLLGGVVLSACGGKNISISVSNTEVVIYTNYENSQYNYKTATISVGLNESTDGVGVQVETGNDVVECSTPTLDRQGRYNFNIETFDSLNSGSAQIKVYSIEDPSIYQYVNVTVYTYLESLTNLDLKDAEGRSDLYVVKGGEKDLTPSKFFEFNPPNANVTDIVWTFQDDNGGNSGLTVLSQGDNVLAEIVDNKTLKVYDECYYTDLTLYASFEKQTTINSTLTFKVIDDSNIASFRLDGNDLITVGADGEISYQNFNTDLVRNDADNSSITGQIVVDTFDSNIELGVEAYTKNANNEKVAISDYENYFKLDDVQYNYNDITEQMTINFKLDALYNDTSKLMSYGNIFVDFVLKYSEYTYQIDTSRSEVELNTYFIPESISVRDSGINNIGGNTIDIYSQYVSSYGYEINVNVYPDDVVLKDSTFKISIDNAYEMVADEDYFIKVFYKDNPAKQVKFTRVDNTNTFVSEAIPNGTALYFVSGNVPSKNGLKIDFYASANQNAIQSIYANLYKISATDTMKVMEIVDADNDEVVDFDFNEIYYISSAAESTRSREFNLRIMGMASAQGLELQYESNSRFNLKMETIDSHEDPDDVNNSYVDVKITVSLNRSNFAEDFSFSISHKTGLKSGEIKVSAFAPIESAKVTCEDKGSTNIYGQEYEDQNFVLENNEGQTGGVMGSTYTDNSLSSLLMTAGSNASLLLDYKNATLNTTNNVGYYFAYLDYNAFATNALNQGIDGETLTERFNNLQFTDAGDNTTYLPSFYNSFLTQNNTYFTYTNGQLRVSDSEFVVYVMVVFDGYDADHENLSMVRFFKLESFYPVSSLRSNLTDLHLYSKESLSASDESLSYADVSVSLRLDAKVPTYDDLEYFSIKLGNGTYCKDENESGTLVDEACLTCVNIYNDYLSLSNFRVENGVLKFRVNATSTQLQFNVRDIITIYYNFNGNVLSTNINVNITQADRVEKVTWVNETEDKEIYLNLATDNLAEQTFTISTSILPDNAYNRKLTNYYHPLDNNSSILDIQTTSTGQSFTLTIGNQSEGGYGYLYLLPEDMVKNVEGVKQIIYYGLADDGSLNPDASYIYLSDINDVYDDLVNGTNGYVNYFLNNQNEKVYYKDVILRIKVTVADGQSEETAIRIYSADELRNIDTRLYYRIMNNLDLTNWTKLPSLSGMLFGNDENISLNISGENLVGELSGTIKNLTMVGNVTGGGFVADSVAEAGLIDNVVVDVRYDENNGYYIPSKVTGGVLVDAITYPGLYIGAITGRNDGVVKNSYAFGVDITANFGNGSLTYAGGIVGLNYGSIENCGVEFYSFAPESGISNNQITADYIGGIAGGVGERTTLTGEVLVASIKNSYVYAFNLANGEVGSEDGSVIESVDYKKLINFNALLTGGITEESVFVGEFIGYTMNIDNVVRVENSFSFMGNLFANKNENADVDVLGVGNSASTSPLFMKDSYITYFDTKENAEQVDVLDLNFIYVLKDNNPVVVNYDQIAQGINYSGFDSSVWVVDNIDNTINFGFAYLKDVSQNVSVSVEQTIKNVEDKVIAFENDNKAVMFYYDVNEQVTSDAITSALTRYNTVSIADFFGITSNEVRSLLVSVDRQDYLDFTTNSLTAKKTSTNLGTKTVTLTLYSRMDFSKSKSFEIMIVNAIPEILTTVNESVVEDGQIVNIQTGIDNSKKVQVILDNTIYLGGNEYTLQTNAYSYDVELKNNTDLENKNYVEAQVSGNSVEFVARQESGNNYVNADIRVGLLQLETTDTESNDFKFNEAIKEQRTRSILISSYVGANNVSVDNTALNITPAESVSFNVTIESDNPAENLALYFVYNDERYEVVDNKVEINENLVLDVSWSPLPNENNPYIYKVLISVNKDYRYKVDSIYSMSIVVNALSQANNSSYAKTLTFTVDKQQINDVNVNAYTIESRFTRNSIWYYTPSSTISSNLVPGDDSILSMEVNPSFAHYTHFTIEYQATSSGNVGSVGLSRLSYLDGYGYYIDSSTTENRTNGLRVNPTVTDLNTGVYYFRIYISSSFTANSNINITITFFDGTTNLGAYTYNYMVDYLKEAEVLVDGAHSIMLAKGDTAQVSITLELDQTLYNNAITLENNSSSITLSEITETVTDSYKVYTATLRTSVLSKLQDENGETKDTGAFYVKAAVSREVNGVQEIKESYATVYLVDFTIDAEQTKVVGSTQTTVYNGGTYDMLNAYINDSKGQIAFDYVIEPESYSYDENNNNEVQAVQDLMRKRTEFIRDGYYDDPDSGYYINYKYNEQTGTYERLTLKERLYYVNTDGSATAIWNGQDYIKNTTFDFSTSSSSGSSLGIIGRQTGRVLMRLQTTVIVGNTTFVYDYDFVVSVEVYTDEEVPMPIYTAEEFLTYLQGTPDEEGNTNAADYILMNDIVLTNYTPMSSQYFNSFDGNGYTIHINSFNYDTSSSALDLALFSEVAENSTIKNVRVNLYNGGQISVNLNLYTTVNIAGFALENNGVVYNCEVVSYYDDNHSASRISGDTGLVVKFVRGNGTDPVYLTSSDVNSSNINISGFINNNNNVITNSRVGGESIGTIISDDTTDYYTEITLPTFVITGQCNVAGFVGTNNGTITASFANSVQINNEMRSTVSQTAGFVRDNSGTIQTSYVQGVYSGGNDAYFAGSTIQTTGKVAGFVYSNGGVVKNCYVNIAFEVDSSRSYLSAGFVYENEEDATITLCYSAVKMSNTDINEMRFSGVDELGNDLNHNKINGITYSYYYSEERIDNSTQASYNTGAYAITDVGYQETFYRFSFSSTENAYDGIWTMTSRGITLISANHIAFSNRYIVYNTEDEYSLFYNTLTDYSTYRQIDLSYGSINNPIIIRNADDFAKATGKAQETENSSYKEYYTDTEVFGNYRLVKNIDFSQIDQNVEGTDDVKLTTTTKDFSGLLDGNSFTISNINLGNSLSVENYGLFARINNGVILNLGLQVDSVHNANANIVGTLAGTAIDSRLISISLSPMEKRDDEEVQAVSIAGYNIVGGLVGFVVGDSTLSDISVTDIDVDSGYYNSSKTVGANDNYTGNNIRELVDINSSLRNNVRYVSYAGGVAGYVDIYDSITDDFVRYSTTTQITEYSISTIRVLNSVDIYGEVAGGLFGYVGQSTLAYDLELEINADMALNNPSYITAKNLYAGGLVGENYGGLYAVYAENNRELQDLIETNMYNYYANSSSVERGQMSIFSYTQNDVKHYGRRYNNPYYIGGLVGYAGSGYISVGYNRLNVVANQAEKFDSSNPLRTLAVGGLVGYVNSSNRYASDVLSGNAEITYYLNEVYFSGVINALTDVSAGGIIGNISSVSKVAMQYVNSVPYYDTTMSLDKVFAVIGGFDKDDKKPTNLYFLNTAGGYYDVITGNRVTGSSSATPSVGVSIDYILASDDTTVTPKVNYINGIEINRPDDVFFNIESVKDFGGEMSAAYTKMNTYFLNKGWDATQWEHEIDTLYPRIVLMPKLSVIYLDAYHESIENMLDVVKNGSAMTIVVRGRTSANSDQEHTDVDLRGYISSQNLLSNFSGTIMSYYEYMGSTDEGTITVGKEVREGGKLIGGHEGDNVGLIIDQPIFNNAGINFTMKNLNIYYSKVTDNTSNRYDGTERAESPDVLNSLIVSGSADSATFENLNIYLDESIEITANQSGYAGLIVNQANSTDFSDITFVLRNSQASDTNEITFKTFDDVTTNAETYYFGLLAGKIEQQSTYKGISVSNILIDAESTGSGVEPIKTLNVNVDVSKNGTASNLNIYFGLWAGQTTISNMSNVSNFDVQLSNLTTNKITETNINLLSSNNDASIKNMYLGGYFGSTGVTGLTRAQISDGMDVSSTDLITNLNFIQNIKIENSSFVNVGLIAGEIISSSSFNFEYDEESNFKLGVSGSYKQVKDKSITINGTDGSVNIGALFGNSNANLTLGQDVNAKFDILGGFDSNNLTYDSKNLYTMNDLSKDTNEDVDKEGYATAYLEVSGKANIGSLVGLVSGGNISFGTMVVKGEIQVNNNNITNGEIQVNNNNITNIGAFGLLSSGTISNSLSSDKQTTLDVDVLIKNTTNVVNSVGGLVGKIDVGEGTRNINFVNIINVGDVVSFAKNIVFGGIIGDAGSATVQSSGDALSNVIYGGNLRNYVKYVDDSYEIVVGGIIGSIETSSNFGINNAYTFGNIFVNYPNNEKNEDESAAYLTNYLFGGIVGRIKANASVETTGQISIHDSYSLLTSFNDRVVKKGYSTNNYQANAIIGVGADLATFEDNYYSSGVNLAYEANEGNSDVAYFYYVDSTTGYSGYRGYSLNNDLATDTIENTDDINIVGSIRSAITNTFADIDISTFEKLNPTLFNNSSISGGQLNLPSGTVSSIKWYFANSEISNDTGVKQENLNNAVIVGNGNTINYTIPSQTSNQNYGLIENFGTKEDSFNAISGFIMNANYNLTISEGETIIIGTLVSVAGWDGSDTSGGISSIILYGVGANGEIDIGGTVTANVGGLVGMMYQGMISNSFVDIDIIYHAGVETNASNEYIASSMVSAVVNNSGNSIVDIIDTFAAGSVQSYVSADLYAFNGIASIMTDGNQSPDLRIYDSYTFSQITRVDYDFGTSGISGTFSFKGSFKLENGELKVESSVDSSVVNGNTFFNNYNSSDDSLFTRTPLIIDNISLTYNDTPYDDYNINIVADTEDGVEGEETAKVSTHSLWFHSPYRNYGYATTGFAYLRNVTVYSQENVSGTVETEDGNSIDPAYNTYSYTRLSNDDITKIVDGSLSQYYFAVPNGGKFKQIADMYKVEEGEAALTGNYKFFLLYDLDLGNLRDEEAWEANNDIGTDTNNKVYIDGQNYEIQFNGGGQGFFGIAYADIENLRIISQATLNSANSNKNYGEDSYNFYGILAGELYGDITNVTVQGDIAINNNGYSVVGGVAGFVSGNVKSVENLVNIRVCGGNSYVGGVVGYLSGSTSTISYSSNSGNIDVNSTSTSYSLNNLDNSSVTASKLSATMKKYDATLSTDLPSDDKTIPANADVANNLNSVIGGIAGYNGGSISNSYNTSTLMNNYNKGGSGNFASGGVAGYSVGSINNSFNTGYVVSGNNANSGIALAGGIVGYSDLTSGGEVKNNINDAKVQAVSKLNNGADNYSIDFSDTSKTTLNNGQGNPKITIIVKYNVAESEQQRLTYANGIGYFKGTDSLDNSNTSLSNDEVTNDGNLGYIRKALTKIYTTQKYGGTGTVDSKYGIVDYYSYKEADDVSKFDIDISGYDAYGFPNRINLNYAYTFNITGFKHNFADADQSTGFMKFAISDTTPNENKTTNTNVSQQKETLSDANTIASLYPGGTTNYYFSMPFYGKANDGTDFEGTYQEIINISNNNASNFGKANGSANADKLNDLYNSINELRKKYNKESETINISGVTYNMVRNDTELEAYTSGWEIDGELAIEMPTISSTTASFATPKLRSVEYTLYKVVGGKEEVVYKTAGGQDKIDTIGSREQIIERDGKYYLTYTAYYNKAQLDSALQNAQNFQLTVGVNYQIEYQITDTFSVTKDNLTLNSANNRVEVMLIDSNEIDSTKLGDYLNKVGAITPESNSYDIQFLDSNGNVIYVYYDGEKWVSSSEKNDTAINKIYVDSNKNGYISFSQADQAEAFCDFIQEMCKSGISLSINYQVIGGGDYTLDVNGGVVNFEDSTTKQFDFIDEGTSHDITFENGQIEGGNGKNYDISNNGSDQFYLVVNETNLKANDIVAIVFRWSTGGSIFFTYELDDSGNGSFKSANGTNNNISYVADGDVITFTVNSGDLTDVITTFKANIRVKIDKFLSTIEVDKNTTISSSDNVFTANYTFDETKFNEMYGSEGLTFSINGDKVTISRNGASRINIDVPYSYESVTSNDSNIQSVDVTGDSGNKIIKYLQSKFNKNTITIVEEVEGSIPGQVETVTRQEVVNIGLKDNIDGTTYVFYNDKNLATDLDIDDLISPLNDETGFVVTEITFSNNVVVRKAKTTTGDVTIYDLADGSNYVIINDGGSKKEFILYGVTDSSGNITYHRKDVHIDERIFFNEYYYGIVEDEANSTQDNVNFKLQFNSIILGKSVVNDSAYDVKTTVIDGVTYTYITYNGFNADSYVLNYSLTTNKFEYIIQYKEENETSKTATIEINMTIDDFINNYCKELPSIYLLAESVAVGEEDITIKYDESLLRTLPTGIKFTTQNYEPVDTNYKTALYYGSSSYKYTIDIVNSTTTDLTDAITYEVESINSDAEMTDNITVEGKSYNNELKLDEDGIKYGIHDFNIEFEASLDYEYINIEEDNLTDYNVAEVSTDNIIITDNIYSNSQISISGIKVYGNNHVITQNLSLSYSKYLVSVDGIANTNGYISNTMFVMLADADNGINGNDTVNVFQVESNSKALNVSLYGSVRKIDSYDDEKLVTKEIEGNKIEIIPTLNVASLTGAVDDKTPASTLKSNISLVGSDAQNRAISSTTQDDGYNVQIKLQGYADSSNQSKLLEDNNSIIISGNGGNGSNGADGNGFTLSNKGENGANGGNGGNAGAIQNNEGRTSITITGANGIAGNGGNGHDGQNAYKAVEGSYEKHGGGNYANQYNYNIDVTTGLSGGGGYGGKAGIYTANNNKTNRKNVTILAGNGGTGGLGFFYSSAGSFEENYYNGFEQNNGENNKSTSSNNYSSWFKTAAGGGSSGSLTSSSEPNITYVQVSGENGRFLGSGDAYYRGNQTDIFGLSSRPASMGYYWKADQEYYDEKLFGNLQLITTFSYYLPGNNTNWNWHVADYFPEFIVSGGIIYNLGGSNYPESYSREQAVTAEYFEDAFKKFLFGGSYSIQQVFWHGEATSGPYKESLEKLFDSYNGQYSKSQLGYEDGMTVWKFAFYGGEGAGNGTGLNGNGGTPFTKEIYGYYVNDSSGALWWYSENYSKVFFTRNDMVTSAGSYGYVSKLNSYNISATITTE